VYLVTLAEVRHGAVNFSLLRYDATQSPLIVLLLRTVWANCSWQTHSTTYFPLDPKRFDLPQCTA